MDGYDASAIHQAGVAFGRGSDEREREWHRIHSEKDWHKRQNAVAPALPEIGGKKKNKAAKRRTSLTEGIVPRRSKTSLGGPDLAGLKVKQEGKRRNSLQRAAPLPAIGASAPPLRSPEPKEEHYALDRGSPGIEGGLGDENPGASRVESPLKVHGDAQEGEEGEQAAAAEAIDTEDERLQYVGVRFLIPDHVGSFDYSTEAVVSRDDGRMGYLVRLPEDGSHKHYGREETMGMIQAHRDHVLAKERAIRQEAKAKEEAATKLQALRRGQVGRRNSIQLAEMKALANPKPKILTKLEEEAEEDAVIEELWGAIDERRSRLDDQRLQVTNMEDGEEKEAALAELAALARAVKEDEAMIQSLDMGEGSPPGTPARLIPGDDEESLKKRSRLEKMRKKQEARKREAISVEKRYWEEIEATRIASEEAAAMKRRGKDRGIVLQSMSLDAPGRRRSVDKGWGLFQPAQQAGGPEVVSAGQAVLKVAAGLGAARAKGGAK